MLKKVKWVDIEKWDYHKWLIPLHKNLIENFPYFKKELSIELLKRWKIWTTQKEVNIRINQIIKYDWNWWVDDCVISYLWKIEDIIRQIARRNELFYKDLPNEWENYLKSALDEILCSMKNKNFLWNIFTHVIEDIKLWNKINFTEIYKKNPSKTTYKYEIAKILATLKEKYNIDFISVWWSGSIIKFWEIEKKDDIIKNIWEIEKCIERSYDYNAVTLNIVYFEFLNFIKEIIIKRNLWEFTQHEFVIYCLEKHPKCEIWLIRTFTKKIFRDILEQWIIIKKKSKINYEIKFNSVINNFYNQTFFPKLKNDSAIEKNFHTIFDNLIKKTALKNKTYLIYLKQEFLKLNEKWEFFVLAKFLEKNNFSQDKKLYYNRILIKLIHLWIIWRKWRERYYIKNLKLESSENKSEVIQTAFSLEKFIKKWIYTHKINKILYYIFKDIENFWINIKKIKEEDFIIEIEKDEIFLYFLNDKFKKYKDSIFFICDEISEKKWINIFLKFEK